MKYKYNLLMLTLISIASNSYGENISSLTHTEQILIDIFRDKEEANKQNSKNMVAATKESHKLTVAQSLTLQNYERTLHTLENKLNSSVNKFNTTLNTSDELLLAQKAMLQQYKKTSTISLCAMTAVISSALTMFAIDKIKEEISVTGIANRCWTSFKELFGYSSQVANSNTKK
jgi:hypothetical protein